MKHRILTAALVLAATTSQACESGFPVSGVVEVPACQLSQEAQCLPAMQALVQYAQAQPDDPAALLVLMQTSPWRMYGADLRITTVEEVAAMARTHLKPGLRRVDLM